MSPLLNNILNVIIIFSTLGSIAGILFPRHTLYHWWARRKLPRFKTASSLLHHLESRQFLFKSFTYSESDDVLLYTDYLAADGFITRKLLVDRSLKREILRLAEKDRVGDTKLYDTDQLLPLARVEKLKLLVS